MPSQPQHRRLCLTMDGQTGGESIILGLLSQERQAEKKRRMGRSEVKFEVVSMNILKVSLLWRSFWRYFFAILCD